MSVQYAHNAVIPAAMTLLPQKMDTPQARAMLLAIGLQESRFQYRKQVRGPARGFWQFETIGVRGVLLHGASKRYIEPVLTELRYDNIPTTSYVAIEHNDILAAVFARLLLWTSPRALPKQTEAEDGWEIYLSCWRPGKPHHETWEQFFLQSWEIITEA